MNAESVWKQVARWLMVAFMVASGIGHFVVTDSYAAMVPASFPAPRLLVFISGAAERRDRPPRPVAAPRGVGRAGGALDRRLPGERQYGGAPHLAARNAHLARRAVAAAAVSGALHRLGLVGGPVAARCTI